MNLILQSLHDSSNTIQNSINPLLPAPALRKLSDHVWRGDGITLDATTRAQLQNACHAERIDASFLPQPRQWQDFKLLAMDMDSTLITIECIDEIADMQGIKAQVAEITEAAMRGEIGFNESLTRRVALLAGLDASALQRVYDERVQLSPGAERMLAAARAHGLKTLLVSGGFTFFTDRMKERLGLDYAYSNVLEIVDGKLTGKVVGNIVNAQAKRDYLISTCAALGVPATSAIAMGDGANDLLMMEVAGLSVAFRAKPKVKAQADVAFDFVGLDGLLALLA